MVQADGCPKVRVEGLVVTAAGDDLLVFDEASFALHTLNSLTAKVYQQADGAQSVATIAWKTGMPVELVQVAVEELAAAQLLDVASETVVRAPRSRREMLKRAAVVAAMPTIVSISAPAAASQGSCLESWEPGMACPVGTACCCVLDGVVITDTCSALGDENVCLKCTS